jgi:hypothetical protein
LNINILWHNYFLPCLLKANGRQRRAFKSCGDWEWNKYSWIKLHLSFLMRGRRFNIPGQGKARKGEWLRLIWEKGLVPHGGSRGLMKRGA